MGRRQRLPGGRARRTAHREAAGGARSDDSSREQPQGECAVRKLARFVGAAAAVSILSATLCVVAPTERAEAQQFASLQKLLQETREVRSLEQAKHREREERF